MSQYPRPRRARRVSEDEMDKRPSAQELAELDELERKRWPDCRWCGRRTQPGLPCARDRCPWQREDGRIVGGVRVVGADSSDGYE